ncbi:Arginase [Wickerhamomyces ciferrii]|uniref:Arginase n=1 Tax=Wickerhamomyces ciferrii (strain ATCC 14091 / BCRC 22168 / CBS 111 / JCM 3599 / NBRC 0793 / NRRL Y-1031 F-60-10) TaxID=1206466 RepID=K0KNW1_WICCF|nr:Arginase [Wickerhamomyces ciferrii]CCH44666.1 Arginase [Wickerhamomyces ciferrii]
MQLEQPHYDYFPKKNAKLILAPFSGGQGKSGVEDGPKYLLRAGLKEQIENLGWSIEIDDPLKDTNYEERKINDKNDTFEMCKRPKIVGEACEKIYKSCKSAALDGFLPITIGGDHSIGMGTVAGSFAKYPDAGLLWIDAHADINTPLTTDSGNLHGCPVAFLMGLDDHSYPPELKWVPKCLSPKKVAYIGLRDIDDGEKKILKENGIAAFSMYHIDRYGINQVIEMALKAIDPEGNTPIHLSYDVDSIDPLYVPATGTPVRGGLTLREGLFVAERVAETGKLIALDIVECNPSLGVNETHVVDTITAGCAVARCALGETIL